MNYVDAIIMGIVEGLTEFLPVSSTGHLILNSKLLNLSGEYLESFEVAIQMGAVLAVVFTFFKYLKNKNYLIRIFLSFFVTGCIGFIFKDYIRELFNFKVVAYALIIGGIIMIYYENHRPLMKEKNKNIEDLNLKQAIGVGFFQCLSFIPGASRALTTIYGGEIIGLKRSESVLYSFLLSVPTIFAASVYSIYKDYQYFTSENLGVFLVGFFVAFFVALFVVKWFIKFVSNNSFRLFGIYRILIGIVVLLVMR